MVNAHYKQFTNYLELLKPLIQQNHIPEYNTLLKLSESSQVYDVAYAMNRSKHLYDQIQREQPQNFSEIVYIDKWHEKIITMEYDDIQQKYDDAMNEINRLTAKIHANRLKNAANFSQLAKQYTAQVANLTTIHNNAQIQLNAQHTTDITKLNIDIAKLNTDHIADITNLKAKHATEIVNLQKRYAKLLNQTKNLAAKKQQLDREKIADRATITASRKTIAKLTAARNTLALEKATLTANNATLTGEKVALETHIQKLDTEINLLKTGNSLLELKITDLDNKINNLTSQLKIASDLLVAKKLEYVAEIAKLEKDHIDFINDLNTQHKNIIDKKEKKYIT